MVQQSDELRQSLVNLVFREDPANLPDLDALRNAIAHETRLQDEIEELEARLRNINEQQTEFADLEAELAFARERLKLILEGKECIDRGQACYQVTFIIGDTASI